MSTVPMKAPSPEAVVAKAKTQAMPKDSLREVFETIVFVVALVLMLKLFVVEAFVIPTGSMAETLLGYNRNITCPQCEHTFPVNSSYEVDPPDGQVRPLLGACCPNCRHTFKLADANAPSPRSGDRVLVHKALYSFTEPDRGDVVVFKFPVDPQSQHTAQNYIKRLWGLGGETLALHRGDLYVARGIEYPAQEKNEYGLPKYPVPDDPRHLWQGPEAETQSKTYPRFKSFGTELWEQKNLGLPDLEREPQAKYQMNFTYFNAETAQTAFAQSQARGFQGEQSPFQLVRKSDLQALAMRRIVYDNDHQAAKLIKYRVPPRWQTQGSGWSVDQEHGPKVFTHSGEARTWLRYQHRVGADPTRVLNPLTREERIEDDWSKIENGYEPGQFPPQYITNFMGYNSGIEANGFSRSNNGAFWVGDLMLECRATIAGPSDEVVLELGKGTARFEARFTGGRVSVGRVGGPELASKATRLTSAGEYRLRFANVDSRLRVWVNGSAVDLGPTADYAPTETLSLAPAGIVGGFAAPNDDGSSVPHDLLAPARIGATGSVTIQNIQIWQDTFFTPMSELSPAEVVDTFYVQPGHYLCLGDNSGQSSDSRKWGLVPDRLMLGKAVFVFFPFTRIGFIE